MTDNEIIKAFEIHLLDNRDCELCPYGPAHYRCDIELLKDILDLINRLQAENERYEKENDEKFDKWKILDERTKERYSTLYEEAKAILKVETIKEFAERLKARAWIIQYYEDGTITPLLSVNDIDNLLKEMAGENDE